MTSSSPPREECLALAVDLGTGGPKVGLVSLVGRMAWRDDARVKTRWSERGGAVQDAEEWWQIICDATRRAVTCAGVRPDRVVAVTVTGQWASTVPVDEHGRPVGDCIMWMDTRGGRHVRRALGGPIAGYRPVAAASWIRRSGAPPSVAGDDSLGHMLYLEEEEPRAAGAARWYLEPVDYLSMRFTGMAAASPASMTPAWLIDTRRPDARAYDPVLVRRAGVNPAKLPPLRPTGSVIGTVQEAIAADLGIPSAAKVVTGTLDLHSAAVGAGAVLEHQPHMVISTTSWISCPTNRKKTDLLHQMATVPGLTPDSYLVVNNQDSAGRCLEWLKDNVIAPDGLNGEAVEIDYPQLTMLASTVPPGSGNVIFTPWLKGEHSPVADRDARGGFHNVSLSTTRAHLIRAVLEGVAYNSRWLLKGAETFTRHRMEPIRLIGGGAQSDLWCQIMADVMDRRIERVADPVHANLRGAAIFAGLALGMVSRTEVRSLVEVDKIFTPDPSHRATYDRLFTEFTRLYKAEKHMFSRLNRNSRLSRV